MSETSRRNIFLTACLVGFGLLSGGIAWQLLQPNQGSPTSQPLVSTDTMRAALEPFRNWPTPASVLVFSGQQHGYLEPCGCAPEFQKGGLARRHGFIQTLKEKGWPVVLFDLGGLLEDRSAQLLPNKYLIDQAQAVIKLQITLQSLQTMGYVGFGIGPEDLFVQNGFLGLAGLLINLSDPPQPRALNSNLGIDTVFIEQNIVSPIMIREVGPDRWSFTAVVGKHAKDLVNDVELKWSNPKTPEVLGESIKKMTEKSDVQVLLLYGSLSEAKEIADMYHDFDVIIHTSQYEEPTGHAEWIGNTMLVTVGTKGKHVGVVGVFPEDERRIRFELVSLDDRFDESVVVRSLLDEDYLRQLEEQQLVQQSPKMPFAPDGPDRQFVGSQVCRQCHALTYKKWTETKHANALTVLREKGKHVNPECVSCHTTGFLYQSGYDGTPKTIHLGGNGCENCHGPGSVHVEIFRRPNATEQDEERARSMMHLETQTPDQNLCVRCHDAENDPKFEFFERWADVSHKTEAQQDKTRWPLTKSKLDR